MRCGRAGRAVIVGAVLSGAVIAAGAASASPYTTVSRLPGVPPVLSWILHSSNTKSLSTALQNELPGEDKSMFWGDTCATNPNRPPTTTPCAFGDLTAKQVVVL